MAEGRSATGRVPARHGNEHHRGINEAFEAALERLSTEVGTGSYPVEVQIHAEVDVSNPGTVGFYSVTLTRLG